MYTITVDGATLYDPRLKDYAITSGTLQQELNTAGTLTITLPDSNPSYGLPQLMKSIIELWEDDTLIFRGRPYAPSVDLYKNNRLEVEGELAFFNDTYQVPFDYYGTVVGLFTTMLEAHNAQVSAEKQFKLGNITVVNATEEGNITRSSEEYLTTWEFIKDKFIGTNLGGYLWVRHEADGNYIDYVPDLNYIGNQKVEQSINLLEASKTTTSEELATVVVPLGAKYTYIDPQTQEESERYTTIESVNQGKVYLESAEGISIYGRIVKIVKHDDITDPSNLLLAGQADLGAGLGVATTITLTAADLSKAGYDVNPFSLGTYAKVKIQNLGINANMLLRALNIDLLNPAANNITLGATTKSLTGQMVTGAQVEQIVTRDVREQTANLSSQILQAASSEIQQSAETIYTNVAETYYTKEQSDEIVAQLSTEITQTADAITLNFNQYVADQDAINEGTAAHFSDISKYIRFVNGNIVLGVEGNELTLRIENDKITFLENGGQIAYWQNRKFYAVDGEFINSLRLGKFTFLPRATGNLSFKKVIE